ncbi:hypothetical protein HZ994_10415 [Akkermansiaceae bacterium]|nr:hypothetical protein HZ994_10415 [Akkermansiaceae bacterium]
MLFCPFRTTAPLILAVLFATPFSNAAPKGAMNKPDFTKGDTIPAGATQDWNLGATGACAGVPRRQAGAMGNKILGFERLLKSVTASTRSAM